MNRSIRIITALIGMSGCISLYAAGEINFYMALPVLAVIPGYFRHISGWPAAPKKVVNVLSAGALTMVVVNTIIAKGDFYLSVAHMTLYFQAIKSFDIKDPWDALQIYFMSLLQLVMTSEMAQSIWIGVVFVMYISMLVSAIVISHFSAEGSMGKISAFLPIAVITLLAVLLAGVFFVSVPRIGAGVISRKTPSGLSAVGFSENVSFGTFGELLKDSSVVMRVELSSNALQHYWRGTTLDYFDGMSWKDTLKDKRRIYKSGQKYYPKGNYNGMTVEQKIVSEPMDTEIIFGLGGIYAVETAGRQLFADSAGAVFVTEKAGRRFAYTVLSMPEIWPQPWYVEPYLQLPDGMDRIKQLSLSVTRSAKDDSEKASQIEAHLRGGYNYSLETSPVPVGLSAMDYFLFASKTGYCEHFATAMVLMLRSVDIPSRIVTGFLGGESSEEQDYVIIRQQNAHSWVEAAIGGRWVRFDPTPIGAPPASGIAGRYFEKIRMMWYRYIVGFTSRDQQRIIEVFESPVMARQQGGGLNGDIKINYSSLAALAGVAALITIFLYLRKRQVYAFETLYYLKLKKKLSKNGLELSRTSTTEDLLKQARNSSVDIGVVVEFLSIYRDVRFGGMKADKIVKDRLSELLKRI